MYLAKQSLTKHLLHFSKVALPGGYLEDEMQEDDDDEKNFNVEKSPDEETTETGKMKFITSG